PLRAPSLLALGDPVFATPTNPPSAPPDHGLLLTAVLPDGNAFKAGLRGGDVLLRYGAAKLTVRDDLKVAEGGGPVPVQVWRDGKMLDDLRVPPGKLGVVVSPDPVAEALRKHRAFGDLVAGRTRDDEAKRLPCSRFEVTAIRALFPRGEVLLGSAASEQQLDELIDAGRLRDFRVLHFATHGRMHPSIASLSALLLARDRLPDPAEQARRGQRAYDGRLTVAAIGEKWRLDADLVTLSACETALGPEGGGEGL